MTSMPASRNARAITFAPRSWPSRPGLATRTRIFFSLISGFRDEHTEWPVAFDISTERGVAEKVPAIRLESFDRVRKARVVNECHALVANRKLVQVFPLEFQLLQLVLERALFVGAGLLVT